MIKAIIAGEEDPIALSELAQCKLKKRNRNCNALKGLIGSHQKLMLETQLRHIDYFNVEINRLDLEIKKQMLPFEEELVLLDTINQFPSAARAKILICPVSITALLQDAERTVLLLQLLIAF